jgi:hypothetical protein
MFRKMERERLAEEAKRKHEAYMRQQNELMKQQIEKRQRKKRKMEEKKMEESRRRSSKGPKKKKKKSGIDKSEIKQIESLEDECKQVGNLGKREFYGFCFDFTQ